MTIQEILRSFVNHYDKMSNIKPSDLKSKSDDEITSTLFPNDVEDSYQEALRVLHTEEITCKTCKYGNVTDPRPNICALCGLLNEGQPLQWEHT